VYKPYPVDSQYTDAQAGIDLTEDKHENQQYTVGVIDVPRESTETAYTVEKSIRALEQMKDGPFSLTFSISPPHPPFLTVAQYTRQRKCPCLRICRLDLRWSPYRLRARR
jgi:hypothetical protein